MNRKSIYIIFIALLLVLPLCLSACGKDVQETESGAPALQTYLLPTEWTMTEDGVTRSYALSYDGTTATVTRDGETVLRVAVDENGNVIQREEAGGAVLTAVYDADGYLTDTLLRDADGKLRQRTVYGRDGRAVREYTCERFNEVTLREFTYGEDGELLTETRYGTYGYHTFAYHANGERAAETVYLLDLLPYYRQEYDENGKMTWEISYDKDGNISHRYEYDAEGKIAAEYDAEGNLYVDERKEEIYDENGNRTESRRYNEDGTLYERYEYDYDESGNEIAWRHYDGDGTLSREVFRTYDEAGVEKKSVIKNYRLTTGELLDTTEMEYDEAGNQIRYTAYDGEGNLSSRTEMAYAFIGGAWHMTLRVAYNGEGSLWFRDELTYDEKGNNTASVSYSADGTLTVRTETTFDERGNQIEHVSYDEQGNAFYREVSVYDEQNNLLEQTDYNGEEISSHTVCENHYEFDDAGRLTGESRASVEARYTYTYKDGSGLRTETCTDGDGNVVRTYETVYDGKGNPRILQRNEDGFERRYEYEWNEEGGLLSRVRYSGDKEVFSRLEVSEHTACTLTEAQYRRLLELLFTAMDEARWIAFRFPADDVF